MTDDKELTGNQKKLDTDGDGKISGDDFKALRSKNKKSKGLNKALEIGWSMLKDDREFGEPNDSDFTEKETEEQLQERLMSLMPRPHSNRVDCANCGNIPMTKKARVATGGVEPYYECRRCGNSVRVM